MDIELYIAAHKPCELPSVSCYVPIQVGAKGKDAIAFKACGIDKEGFLTRDDDGENISEKNPYYCELTAMYYIWKNVTADVVGLCHYRRYFANRRPKGKNANPFDYILKEDEVSALAKRAEIIVPKKNKYYIETLYSHYAHTHDGKHLDLAKDIVAKDYPEFLPFVNDVYAKTSGSMYNMCIMKKTYFDEYCQWVFDILEKLEPSIDTSELSAFDARVYGRVSEILFNVWIAKKIADGVSVIESKVFYTEKIDWIRKIGRFLQAKIIGKKYTKSA